MLPCRWLGMPVFQRLSRTGTLDAPASGILPRWDVANAALVCCNRNAVRRSTGPRTRSIDLRSKRSVLAERGLDGGENLARLRQAELGNGLPELNFQGRRSAALARDFGLSLALALLHRERDELTAVRFGREAPGRLACFSRLLCSHVGGVLSLASPVAKTFRSGCYQSFKSSHQWLPRSNQVR